MSKRRGYRVTLEGWKPAPMREQKPPKWYHRLIVKCLEWLKRRLKHE